MMVRIWIGGVRHGAFRASGQSGDDDPSDCQAAGLTTRTFFRHFSDKGDVLFRREREFAQVIPATLLAASDRLGPRELVVLGLRAAGAELQQLRAPIERRRRVIRSEPHLRERELLQYDRLSETIKSALLERATQRREALVLSKLAAVAFELGLEQWLHDPEQTLTDIFDATCAEILAGSGPRSMPAPAN